MTQQQNPLAPQPKTTHAGRNALLASGGAFAVLVASVALLGNRTTEAPSAGASHAVVYQADGAGTSAGNYTLQSEDGGTRQGEAALPLKNQAGDVGLTFTGFKSGDFVYLSVQNANGSGSVTCRIMVDGVVIADNTSDGGYVIATCKGTVP